jgi:hypothetical protein
MGSQALTMSVISRHRLRTSRLSTRVDVMTVAI